jgi:hypothetical protein
MPGHQLHPVASLKPCLSLLWGWTSQASAPQQAGSQFRELEQLQIVFCTVCACQSTPLLVSRSCTTELVLQNAVVQVHDQNSRRRYFLSRFRKVKKANGQILAINEVRPHYTFRSATAVRLQRARHGRTRLP